jgi:hypothetical protein
LISLVTIWGELIGRIAHPHTEHTAAAAAALIYTCYVKHTQTHTPTLKRAKASTERGAVATYRSILALSGRAL